MKLTKSTLKRMVREELLKEQMDIRSVFYELGDKIENLRWVADRNTQYTQDRKLKSFAKQLLKVHDTLKKHLDKTYGDWD